MICLKIFNRLGTLLMIMLETPGPLCARMTDANVEVVQQVDWQWPRVPVQRAAVQTWLRRMSTHRIMCNNLQLFPYSFRLNNSLVLLPLMNVRRSRALCCSSCMLAKSMWETIGSLMKWTFPFDGFVNKQNWGIWGTEDPYIALPSFLNPPKVMVWATICSKRLIW